MSERRQKARHGPRYSFFPIILTVIFLTFSGSFQIGYQDIYYEHYNRVLNTNSNESIQYLTTEKNESNATEEVFSLKDTFFSPKVSHTSIYFHLGVAIGSLLFGMIFLRLGAKWSFLIFSGFAMLTSTLIALDDVIQNHLFLLSIIRSIFGICVGFLTCLQVSVLNDIAMDEDRIVFHFFTMLAVPLGYNSALFMGREPFTTETIWYGGHLVSVFPLLLAFLYVLICFRDPPSTLIIRGLDEKALKSAQYYYGDYHADYALAETHDRVKIKQSIPTLLTIWNDKVAMKSLFLAALVNIVAGFSGDRFSWIFLCQYISTNNIELSMQYASLFFVIFLSMIGSIFCLLFLTRFERKHLLIITAALVAITELIFGFFWQFSISFSLTIVVQLIVSTTLKALQHLFLTTGLNSIAFFVATDLSFSGSKSILLSFSFIIRALTMAFHPYLVGLLYNVSPLASSILTAIPLIGFSIFAGFRFPRLHSLTPYQILQTFGYTFNLEATAEEIQNVRKNMHKLWQNPKEA